MIRAVRPFTGRANCAAPANLAAQVLTAQEAERRRFGREMHDDLGQRVALLQLEIESMKRQFTAQPLLMSQLDSLRGSVALLAEDLHRICERLHPVVLDNLGLVRGVAALCEDQINITGMKTVFVHGSIPQRLPGSVSLCLYRVVQEALQNAAKHSGAGEVLVTLRREGEGVRAEVRDNGCGFDTKVRGSSGLGLIFIAERVNLLDGLCSITSFPGKGTRISAWVRLRESGK